VEFGFAEAALRGAPLIAMHIWPHGTGRADAEGGFLNLLENWSGKYPDVPVELAVRHGLDPAIVLAAASRSACLAVVGAPCEPAGARRVSPNSALAAFIDRAGCPVAVVPRRVGRGA
ncbi:MAG TPA: hypothetical protein VFT95_02840, partial [Micromonosporaceae bacterium]|nr:hypothetical protein [Micromonosporaceae bacterium]